MHQKLSCRIDGTVGQRITFEANGRFVTMERMDGRRLGDRTPVIPETYTQAEVANKIHIEHVFEGRLVYSKTIIVGRGHYGPVRRFEINAAKYFLIRRKLPLAHKK